MGSGHRATSRRGQGLGETSDSVDSRANICVVGTVSAVDQRSGEECDVIGVVGETGDDPVDASSTEAARNRSRISVPHSGLILLMGQTLTSPASIASFISNPGTWRPSTPISYQFLPAVPAVESGSRGQNLADADSPATAFAFPEDHHFYDPNDHPVDPPLTQNPLL